MEKYFYKVVDNIDFVWKIVAHAADPYKKGGVDFGQYVCNQRVFNPNVFESLDDFEKFVINSEYREIQADMLNEENCFFDRSIGLLHADDYWTNLHALRQVNCLGQIAPIVFGNSEKTNVISNKDRESYLKLISCGMELGQEIYNTAHSYFKSLWEFDSHFAETNLDTLEKFLPTLELQAIYLSQDEKDDIDSACIVFRPSWDPEHGLALVLNLDTKEVGLYED